MVQFSEHSVIELIDAGSVVVKDSSYFNKGGQGFIYRVSYGDAPAVLKWYHSKSVNTNDFKINLIKLTGKKIDGFILPRAVTKEIQGEFGYVMDQIPQDENIVSISEIIYDPKIDFKAAGTRMDTYVLIADAFAKLHSQDLSFMDINDNNIFVNVKNPAIYICDCDNIAESGTRPSVKGKTGFMAPEIVKKEHNPDIYSDRFSLAIVFFLLIVKHMPFVGRGVGRMDREAMEGIYGNPVFIFDPHNESNRPEDESYTEFWDSLPDYVRQAFITTFTKGSVDRDARTTAEEWVEIFSRWKSEYDPRKNRHFSNTPKCKRRYQPIFFIVDSSSSMMKENRMEEVNRALNRFIKEAQVFKDTEVVINILQFSGSAEWYYDKLIPIEQIQVINLGVGDTYTHLDEALIKLDEELKKDNVLNDSLHPNNPLIMLLTDGYAKRDDYLMILRTLQKNYWFKKSYKCAIGIKTDSRGQDMLLDFTGNQAYVRQATNDTKLGDFIIAMTMTVTQSITQNNNDEDYRKAIEEVA